MIIYHPARTKMGELEAKWRRHIAHDLEEHRTARRPMSAWRVRALAVLLSALPHSLKLLTSDRLSGVGNRLRGVGALFRIRAYRFTEMLKQARNEGPSAAASWNRAEG